MVQNLDVHNFSFHLFLFYNFPLNCYILMIMSRWIYLVPATTWTLLNFFRRSLSVLFCLHFSLNFNSSILGPRISLHLSCKFPKSH